MERNKKLQMLVPVLIVVLIFVWARAFKLKSPRAKRIPQRNIASPKISSSESDLASLIDVNFYQRQKKQSSFTDWGRNPFDLPVVKVTGKIILNGILWDSQNPSVLINDRILSIGDTVDGYTVVEIRPDSVILNDGTKDLEVRLSW